MRVKLERTLIRLCNREKSAGIPDFLDQGKEKGQMTLWPSAL
jgi:hypothetical protein